MGVFPIYMQCVKRLRASERASQRESAKTRKGVSKATREQVSTRTSERHQGPAPRMKERGMNVSSTEFGNRTKSNSHKNNWTIKPLAVKDTSPLRQSYYANCLAVSSRIRNHHTQIRFLIGGERVTCRGLQLTNSQGEHN